MPELVVGVDDSPIARSALRWALRHAALTGMAVTVITVLDPLLATALWDDRPEHNTRDSYVASARQELEQAVADAVAATGATDVDVDTRVVVGHRVKELVEASEGAELLVVGSRGNGLFATPLLGSTSAGVARHAHCSVMIVRPADSEG